MPLPRAFLLDLEGTLYGDAGPEPGAPEVIRALRRRRVPFRCVSNTTRRSRAGIVDRVRAFGLDLAAEDILTAVLAGAEIARHLECRVVAPYIHPAALPDLGEFELVGGTSGRPAGNGPPDAVLIGDLGALWTYDLTLEAFRSLLAGSRLIALSRDRYYQRRDGLALDAGAWVAGLEYAAGVESTVAGKPSPAFFLSAARTLGVPPAETAMVGDDVWTDVEGAQRAGYQGWLVRSGKFREELLASSAVVPDRILGGIGELLADLR